MSEGQAGRTAAHHALAGGPECWGVRVRINPHDGSRAPVTSPVAGSRRWASADTQRADGIGVLASVVVHAAVVGAIMLAVPITPRPMPDGGVTVALTWTEPAADGPATPAADTEAEPEMTREPTRTVEADVPAEPDMLALLPPPPEPQPAPLPTDEPVPAVARLVAPPPTQPAPTPSVPTPSVPTPPVPTLPVPNVPVLNTLATAKPRPVRPSPPTNQASPARSQTAARVAETGAGAPSDVPQSPVPALAAISPGWNAAVAAWLQRNKTYPAAARTRGEEGSGHVRFTVARDGRVLAVELTRPTGSSTLDDALRRLLTGATVPAFPDTMPHDQVTVQVQVRYSLDQ